jgi:hypothetical protein
MPSFTDPVYAKDNNSTSYAVYGDSSINAANHIGVVGIGYGPLGTGVFGQSKDGHGVYGSCIDPTGHDAIVGESFTGSDTWWSSGVVGVNNNVGNGAFAGWFEGKVWVTKTLHAAGGVHLAIDHPIDPANKYLYHSSVESPDMKNLYDGVVTLDAKGEAVVDLPDWFNGLNKDFRYQLTAISGAGPNLHIADQISETDTKQKSHFKIAGGTSGMKVSWQVTGVRNDPYAKANPIQVEQNKSDIERGLYIHPQVYGQAPEKLLTLKNIRKDKFTPTIPK